MPTTKNALQGKFNRVAHSFQPLAEIRAWKENDVVRLENKVFLCLQMTILQGTSIIKGYSNKIDVVFYILACVLYARYLCVRNNDEGD